jgi:hypothetical protein
MSEGWSTSRRKDTLIPPFIVPTYGIGRDGKGIHLVVYGRDGSIIYKYPLKDSPLIKHPELFKGEPDCETSWAFGRLIYRYRRRRGTDEPELIPMDQTAIHPYNIRYIPIEDRKDSPHFQQLVDMAKSRALINPVIAVPVDNPIIKILKYITEQAEKHGLNPENILAGMLWRRVGWKGNKLVAREDDEVHSLISSKFGSNDGEIKYLVIDGYQRFGAQYYAFRDTIDSWKSPPYVYAHVLVEEIDVLSMAYISRTINLYERSIAYDLDAMSAFANLFELGDSLVELGNMVGVEDYRKAGEYLRPQHTTTPGVVKGTKFSMAPVEIGKEEAATVEEEPEEGKREERRRERREESAVKESAVGLLGVSTAQRQLAPTFSYAPAQPQPSAQMPISPPVQPVREETLRPGAPSLSEPDKVIRQFLNRFENEHQQMLHYVIKEGVEIEIVTTIKYDERKLANDRLLPQIKKKVGEMLIGRARFAVFNRMTAEIDGARETVTVVVPVLYTPDGSQFVRCPNCNRPILAVLPWCVYCKVPLPTKVPPIPFIYETEQDRQQV